MLDLLLFTFLFLRTIVGDHFYDYLSEEVEIELQKRISTHCNYINHIFNENRSPQT